LVFLCCTAVTISQPKAKTNPLAVDFRQAANNYAQNSPGYVHWWHALLHKTNAVYFEGMSVPQRIILTNIGATTGNQHSLTFSHRAAKNGKHAYDFLTSYGQALATSAAIAGPTTLVNLNECGADIGPPSSLLGVCSNIRGKGYHATVTIPNGMGTLLSHDVAARVRNYELKFGPRTLQIHGDAPITSAVLVFSGYTNQKDAEAEYTLMWTSASNSILIELAGHLAMGDDVTGAGTGIGYGSGLGAGSIPGASYHFKLGALDGRNLGSRDNQIKDVAIRINLSCGITGPDIACAGTQNAYTSTNPSRGLTFSWDLSNNTSGASIIGSTSGPSVLVDAGTKAGEYTLTSTISDGIQTVTCPTQVTVSDITVTAAAMPLQCAGGTCPVTVAATGGTAPYTGTGTFVLGAGTHTFTVTDAKGCSGTTSVTISAPTPLAAAANTTAIICNTNLAEVTVTATGGKPPYKGTGKFNRGPGTHTFDVYDDNNCLTSTSATVPSAAVLSIASNATPIDCFGGTSTVTVSATGGTPPYTGIGTFTRTAGTYTFTVSDANSCSGTTTVTITQPAQALSVNASATPILCYGGNSTVTVTATGGTAPYTGTGTFTRTAGTYTFTVTDANGCSASSAAITITEPTQAIAVTASATPILCFGGNSTVTVAASGGTPPYTGTGTFTRTAGTYTFTVTDANGCSATSTALTITEPAQSIAVTASATPISCFGGNSTVTVSASGGTPPYTGTGTFTRSAGTYTFTVTDANGCSATSTALTISQPAQSIAVTASATPISCFGGNSTVTVTASGGTPPYTGTGTFTRTAGTYTFTVTDANGCAGTSAAVIITEPSQALAVSASATPIACNGGNSTVTVSATGGTPPYTGTGTFSKAAGTYSFTVTDANGCTATSASVVITDPPQLTAAVSATPVTCTNTSSTVTVSATGGTAPYTGTGTFSRSPGTYSFTVTDANNCTNTATITISGSPTLLASASATPILCYGGNSTVTVTASGGAAPYTGVGTFTRAAGTYTFTVTDANNCSATTSVVITEPTQALAATASATPILCYGGNSTVTVTATGGTAPYTGTGTFTRAAGTYTFTVTDANGCTATTASVTITEPAQALAASASATPILCYGGNSTVTVTATGGTAPYTGTGTYTRTAGTYTFTVTDANGCTATTSVTITEPAQALLATASATPILCYGGNSTVTVTASGGTAPYTGTGTFTRTAGTYTFTVTDANGCTATTASVVITEPAQALAATASATPILCYGGNSTVTVSATGGTPPYGGTGTFTRTAGTYTFTVTDANGCTATTASVTITEPAQALFATASATPILCYGGTSTVTVSASGGTPPYSGTGTYTRSAGTYTFTVTDANGCTATTASVNISQPAQALTVTANATSILCHGGNATVTVQATGGTAPYTGTGTFTRTAGTYTFTVTDANGCSASSASITITEPAQALSVAASATPILCYGEYSVVTVTATGGTPPYSGTGSFNRTAGTYSFTVTDANGCTANSASLTITEPAELTAGISATPITCTTTSSTVTVSAVGGTTPYTGVGTFTRTPGTYSFIVTDANGCSDTASITISGSPTLLASAIATPILCNGGNSTVTVSASGGAPPYIGVGTFTRTAGTYTFTVTDANNCTASASVTITQPSLLTVSATATTILCNGDYSTVTVSAAGGQKPYTGIGTFSKAAGTYTFTVTDDNGCTANTSITITQPTLLAAAANAAPILCNGSGSSVTVTATGGTLPYTGTGVFTRSAGMHSFVVTDANGCSDTTTVQITEPTVLTAAASATPVLCYGDYSTVTVTASGGTPPYSGTGNFSLIAGTYTLTVTDANNCTATASVTITEPPMLNAAANAPPILCHGSGSTVTVNAVGGTLPYTGTGTFNRSAGTHTFIVTDGNGCADTTSITLIEPPDLVAAITATPILCNGGGSTVTVTASGGTGPYTGTGIFNRTAGTHTFLVTDANGCTDTATLLLTEPPLLTVAISKTPVLCYGDYSTVVVTATGGKAPYTGTGTFNVTAGTYSFTVTDDNNCSKTETVTITEPPMLRADATAPPILCYGGNTPIDIDAVGGTPPYLGTGKFSRQAGTHVFVVTDANGCTDTVTITLTQPTPLLASATATAISCHGGTSTVTVTASGGTPPYAGTGPFTRGAGTHTFTVTDANGCTATVSITITEPPVLAAQASAPPVTCGRDTSTVTVTAIGGTPPYQGVGTFPRTPGMYTFTVIDSNGCTATATVLVAGPTPVIITVSATPILCFGSLSTITVSASGGTPPYSGVGSFTRGPGTYFYTVTDANGCKDTASVTITQPPPLTAASTATPILCYGENSTVTVTAAGGTPPYSGIGTFNRGAGIHTFTVTDANGCTATTTVTITEPPLLTVTGSAPGVTCGKDSSTVTITAYGGTPPYTGTGTVRRVRGTYTFTVTDANGCMETVQVTVAGPPPLFANISATPILCNGGNSTITVTAMGGTPPYTGTGTFTKGAGTYTFVVTDANNCTDTVTISVTQPLPLLATCRIGPCVGGMRTISATVSGGTPPYNYTWNPGNIPTPDFDVPCSFSGTVTLVLRDANYNPNDPNSSSCEATCSLTVLVKASDNPGGSSAPTADEYALYENYPNPFNPSTTISYFIPEASQVRLSIVNMLGETVKTLVNQELSSGPQYVTWDATADHGARVPSGSYFYRIQAKSLVSDRQYVRERMMLLLK
jgi:hypothetical protein